MSTGKILVKNTLWLGLVEAMSKIIMFGVTVSVVRYLGPTSFGTYNLAFSYVAMFMILSDFGLGIVTTREVSKHKDQTEKYIANILGLKLALSGLITILIIVSFLLIPASGSRSLILAAMTYNLIQNLGTVFASTFSAWERMELVFLSKLSYYVGVLIAAFTVIYFKGTVLQIVLAYIVTTTLSFFFSANLIKKMGFVIRINFNKSFWIELLRETIPFMGLAIVGTAYANNDTLLIGKYFGSTSTGFYQAAYKIFFAFQSINVINNAIFPRINVLIHENKSETLSKLIKMVVGFSVLGLIPLAIVISIFQNQIVNVIYGSTYLSAAPAMAILVWSGVVNYFRVLTSNLLFAKNKQRTVFIAVAVGMFINLGINIFILPYTSFVVSAWGMLISEVAILLVTIGYLRRN